MTSTQAAYDAGIRAALAMAEAVADGIEAQPSTDLRRQSAAQALRSLAVDGAALLIVSRSGSPADKNRGDAPEGGVVV